MADSWEQIVNGALTELGAPLITSLDDESEPARVMKAALPAARDAVLRNHPWNCALVYTALPALAEAPPHSFGFQYELPTDPWCLRVWQVTGGDDDQWKVVGRRILTDLPAPLSLVYIARITDPQLIDASLQHALEVLLAARTAFRLTGSRSLGDDMLAKYLKQILPAARSADGQEGTLDAIRSEFLEARL